MVVDTPGFIKDIVADHVIVRFEPVGNDSPEVHHLVQKPAFVLIKRLERRGHFRGSVHIHEAVLRALTGQREAVIVVRKDVVDKGLTLAGEPSAKTEHSPRTRVVQCLPWLIEGRDTLATEMA